MARLNVGWARFGCARKMPALKAVTASVGSLSDFITQCAINKIDLVIV
jgi:hypothetical protein